MEKKIYDIEYKDHVIPIILKWVAPHSRVLEFGTAMGYMTKCMKEKLDCRITGIELNEEMAGHAALYAEKMIVADLDSDPWDKQLEGKFDFIIFGDVLEHLRDPQNVIMKAKNFLLPEGSLLTSIPNIGHNAVIMSLKKGEFHYQPNGLLDDSHIHFFTRGSIKQMMTHCGLVCIGEKNKIIAPGATEFKKFYLFDPIAWLTLSARKDGHIYQFINRWAFKGTSCQIIKNERCRLSLGKYLLTMGDDFNEYLFWRFKIKLKLPSFLKKKIRK